MKRNFLNAIEKLGCQYQPRSGEAVCSILARTPDGKEESVELRWEESF